MYAKVGNPARMVLEIRQKLMINVRLAAFDILYSAVRCKIYTVQPMVFLWIPYSIHGNEAAK